MSEAAAMRVMIVQYAGDYRAADQLLRQTGQETYYGHREVFATLDRVMAKFGETAILICQSQESYDVRLASGLRLIACSDRLPADGRPILDAIDRFDPTHLIILGPFGRVLRTAQRKRRRVLCIFADSFELNRLRLWKRHGRFVGALRSKEVEWIANHGINASRSLARLGVSPDKIIPWDWTHGRRPHDWPARTTAPADPLLFFAGSISERKGVADLINAVALLRHRGVAVRAEIAGQGEIAHFQGLARQLGVEEHVTFPGTLTNAVVVARMREAAIVTVTSQHAYPEGFPLTIYEALSTRTPIVASDHPMFAHHLVDGRTAMIYRSRDAMHMAGQIETLLTDETLYARLSEASLGAWEALQIDTKWGDVILHWLANATADRAWLAERTLARR